MGECIMNCPHCGKYMGWNAHGVCGSCHEYCGCSFNPTSMNDFCAEHRPKTQTKPSNPVKTQMLNALMAAEESIVTFMGSMDLPMESGAGSILTQIRESIRAAEEEAQ